jgi:intein/homing endonuclease
MINMMSATLLFQGPRMSAFRQRSRQARISLLQTRLMSDRGGPYMDYIFDVVSRTSPWRIEPVRRLRVDPRGPFLRHHPMAIDYGVRARQQLTDRRAADIHRVVIHQYGDTPIATQKLSRYARTWVHCSCPWFCVAGDTRISTPQGLLPIQDQLGGGAVLTQHGAQTARTLATGMAKTYLLTTTQGYALRATPNERLWVLTPELEQQWRRLDEIKPGDIVGMASTSLWPRRAPRLSWTFDVPMTDGYYRSINGVLIPCAGGKHGHQSYSTPQTLSVELAKLLGYLVAEGSSDRNGLEFTQRRGYALRDFRTCWQQCFPDAPLSDAKVGNNPADRVLSSRSVYLAQFFQKALGYDVTARSWNKQVPSIIFRAPKSQVAAFLRAYFEGDGSRTATQISCSTASPALAAEVQQLLLLFGVVCTRSVKYPTGGRPAHFLVISGVHAQRFMREIGFCSPAKNRPLASLCGRSGKLLPYVRESLTAVMPPRGYYQDASDRKRRVRLWDHRVLGNSEGGRVGAAIVHRYLRGYGKKLAKVNPEYHARLRALLSSKLEWLEVKSIDTPLLLPTYDATVPKLREFVANGFVVHNTFVSEYALAKAGSSIIVNGNGQPPRITNPRRLPVVCVADDALISTARGLVSADAVATTDQLLTMDGHLTPVRRIYRHRADTTVVVTTSTGRKLTCTPEHPWLVLDPKTLSLGWTNATDLERGVVVSVGMVGQHPKTLRFTHLKDVSNRHPHASTEIRLPTTMSAELARIIGYLLSEGSVSHGAVCFGNGNYAIVADYVACWLRAFGVRLKIKTESLNDKPYYTVNFGSVVAMDFLHTLGVSPALASDKTLPWSIAQAPLTGVINFLAAFIDGDGSLDESGYLYRIGTRSQQLALQLQTLLNGLGIHSTVRVQKNTGGYGVRQSTFSVHVGDLDAGQLANLLPLPRVGHKQVAVINARRRLRKPGSGNYIPGLKVLLLQRLREVTTTSDKRTATKQLVITQNMTSGEVRAPVSLTACKALGSVREVTYSLLQRFPELLALLTDDQRAVIGLGLNFEVVVSKRSAGARDVVDFTTDAGHFLANSLVTHNCKHIWAIFERWTGTRRLSRADPGAVREVDYTKGINLGHGRIIKPDAATRQRQREQRKQAEYIASATEGIRQFDERLQREELELLKRAAQFDEDLADLLS